MTIPVQSARHRRVRGMDELATLIARVDTIPAKCPVRVLALSAGSAAIQRIAGGAVQLCDRDNVVLASELESVPAPF